MLTYDPNLRPSAQRILKHSFFKPLRDEDRQKENAQLNSFMSPLKNMRNHTKTTFKHT